ncbi:MAG: (2Fe-2S) ferredoxin domain-containing protein [Kofleriaceae bacterium]|nr:(2Fe-2S) ferredoxin domain-containing protein [Kofleriaceae bacterium]
MPERRYRIVVCRGPDCGDRRDSASVHAALTRAVADAGLGAVCELDWQSCFGRCSQGPNVLVREVVAAPIRRGLADLPQRLGGGPRAATALYNHVSPVHAAEIVASHIGRGAVVRHLIEPLVAASPAAPPPRPAEPTAPEVREDVKVP